MTKILDGFGKPCPMPLVMAKEEIDAGCHDVAVRVDNETAVTNLMRLAQSTDLAIRCEVIEGGWLMTFSEGDVARAHGCDIMGRTQEAAKVITL